jgi:hypothetical protein
MKFLILLLPLLAFAKSKNFDLRLLADDLNVKVSEEGKCLFTRNQVNSVQLHNKFNTTLKDKVLVLRNEPLEPYWNCIYLQRNFRRDSVGYFITKNELERSLEEKSGATASVSGKIRYVGIIKKKYRYDLTHVDGVTTAIVKVHFNLDKMPIGANIEEAHKIMDEKIEAAQAIWNEMAPSKYRFKFIRVDNERDAFFSPKLLTKDTNGPFDSRWSLQWSEKIIAHEFGHMLGLDDEYDQITNQLVDVNRLFISKANREHLHDFSDKYNFGNIKAMRCDMTSMMCNHYNGKFNAWHFYTIFKRFFQ